MTYKTFFAAMLLSAAPALAQGDPPRALMVSGSAALVSDYRFRGVSQSDEELAAQAGITVTHRGGLYAGFWGSNLAGWGTFGGSNLEIDLFGGIKREVTSGVILDAGLLWYMYPGGASKTDFAEPYAKLSGTLGPVNGLVGVAYAPRQQALGRWYLNGTSAAAGVYDDPGDKEDNLYVWGDVSAALPGTGLTAKAHIGYSDGNRGLGPNATSVAPTGKYFDWMGGLDYAIGPVTLGVAYADTNISRREEAYLRPSFSEGQDGRGSIADATVVFSVTAAF